MSTKPPPIPDPETIVRRLARLKPVDIGRGYYDSIDLDELRCMFCGEPMGVREYIEPTTPLARRRCVILPVVHPPSCLWEQAKAWVRAEHQRYAKRRKRMDPRRELTAALKGSSIRTRNRS